MVIPMHGQYEQQCNAAAAATLGVPVITNLSNKYYENINTWLSSGQYVKVDYPDITADIIAQIMQEHVPLYKEQVEEAIAAGN